MAVKAWKERGFSRILLRLDDVRILNLANIRHSEGEGGYSGYAQTWQSVTRDAIKTNMFRLFVDSCHAQQMEVFGWITVFDEGTPADVEYMVPDEAKKSWPMYDHAPTRFLWVTKFTQQHPEFLVTDRARKRVQHGVMEYAYPEVRRYMRKVIQDLVERYDVDGVFLSTRSHSVPAEHGDQFGFNEPVVKEFERRYGVNILKSVFDLEQWRQLRGGYLTRFLREVNRDLKARGKQLSIGIPRVTTWVRPLEISTWIGAHGFKKNLSMNWWLGTLPADLSSRRGRLAMDTSIARRMDLACYRSLRMFRRTIGHGACNTAADCTWTPIGFVCRNPRKRSS